MSRLIIHRLPIIDRLYAHAVAEDLSLRGVGRQLEVTPTTVANWYRGVTQPALDARLQRRLAQLLGITPRRVLELFDLDLSDQLVGGPPEHDGN